MLFKLEALQLQYLQEQDRAQKLEANVKLLEEKLKAKPKEVTIVVKTLKPTLPNCLLCEVEELKRSYDVILANNLRFVDANKELQRQNEDLQNKVQVQERKIGKYLQDMENMRTEYYNLQTAQDEMGGQNIPSEISVLNELQQALQNKEREVQNITEQLNSVLMDVTFCDCFVCLFFSWVTRGHLRGI